MPEPEYILTVTPQEASYMLNRYRHLYPEVTAWVIETLTELAAEMEKESASR